MRTIDWKTRLKIINDFERLLEDCGNDPDKKVAEKAFKLLSNVREGKQWIIDHYPEEEFLQDTLEQYYTNTDEKDG